MRNTRRSFCVTSLLINGKGFSISDFNSIVNGPETDEIGEDGAKEVIKVRIIERYEELPNGFLGLYFYEGEKYPHPNVVVNTADPLLPEEDNPRSKDQVEMDKQFFVLFDVNTQKVYLSDLRKKDRFRGWLEERLGKMIVLKSIVDEADFLKNLESVSKLRFSVSPNLLNLMSEGTLSDNLARDVFGFGAEKATLELSFNRKKVFDKLSLKLKRLIDDRQKLDELVLIGYNDEDMESTLNMNNVINKVEILVPQDENSKLLDPANVFVSLTTKIING